MNPFTAPLAKALRQPIATTLAQVQQADADSFNERAATLLVHLLKGQAGYTNAERPMIQGDTILFRVHRHQGPASASWVSASFAGHAIRVTPVSIIVDDREIILKDAKITDLNVL